MSKWSPELTFFPREKPEGIPLKTREERIAVLNMIVEAFNRAIDDGSQPIPLCHKLDPFECYGPKAEHYVVEITPYHPFETEWLTDPIFEQHMNGVFKVMEELGYVPALREMTTDPKTGRRIEKHWPGGGCHLHYEASLFNCDSFSWYRKMEAFHKVMIIDYANNPWIRWLFKQWFADEGTDGVIVSAESISNLPSVSLDNILHVGHHGVAINQRMRQHGKTSYLTFEFRMFSMVESARELILIARFLDAWVQKWVGWVSQKVGDNSDAVNQLPITITKEGLDEMSTVRGARKAVNAGLSSLKLDPKEYAPFFERHYRNRIKYGEMV